MAAGLAALAGAAVWRSRTEPPLALLARASSKPRRMELRVEGAPFSEMAIARGGGFSRPAELAEAEMFIQRRLETHAADAGWGHARGRANLIEGSFDDAISDLELARDLSAGGRGEEAGILVDLASAYFERGQTAHRPVDFSMAIEALSRALELDPSSLAARYNRAMVFERAYLYPNAVDEWQRYLAEDHSSPWAAEGRRRLEILRRRIAALDPAGQGMAGLVELRLNQVLDGSLPAAQAEQAAAEMSAAHDDRWLAELLPLRNSPQAAELSRMVAGRLALRMGAFEGEMREMERAAPRIEAAPLRAWLEYERLFRAGHSPHTAECIPEVGELVEMCRRRHYGWLLIQSLLERSTCEAGRGDFALAESTDSEAMEAAREHDYPLARLRAAGYLATFLSMSGQFRDAAQLEDDSLAFFWSRPLPYARGQECFHDMMLADEGLGRLHAAKAAAETAALMAHLAGVTMNEAIVRARWAGFADQLGLQAEASAQYAQAERLFDAMAPNPSVEAYRAFAESFAARHGDRATFARLAPVVKTATNPFVVVSYLHTSALLAESDGRLEEARRNLADAIAVVEKNAGASKDAHEVREWRDQLQACSRDLTRLSLASGPGEGYRAWQRFLRADETLGGLRPDAEAGGDGSPAAVVTFARLGERYGVWARSGDGVKFAWVGEAAAIDRQARAYAALCADPNTTWDFARGLGARLHADLLDFALTTVPAHGLLLIQPDGELARLPWAALAAPGGEPLGERFAVAVLPTPLEDTGAARVPEIRVNHALVVGASFFDPERRSEYRPLPGVEEEIAAVRRAFPSADVLEGANATTPNISRLMAGADALHFAGHAVLAGNRIQLLVAPDAASEHGLWQPVAAGHLKLAVLSACATARYRDPEDPQPDSLASSLLFDDARAVVASLWAADSSAASFFMQSFYRSLRVNHMPARAMADAWAETRKQSAWSRPYYWACFSLFLRI